MTRADFAIYRHAFDRLLDCAAGKDAKQVCVDGWMHNADSLIPSGDQTLARSLLDYYIDGNLRSKPAQEKLCTTASAG
jgi:hypothetical protein